MNSANDSFRTTVVAEAEAEDDAGEEDAGDFDPLAMMGGMGAEEVYQVTMHVEETEPRDIIGSH